MASPVEFKSPAPLPPGVSLRFIGEGTLGPLIRAKDWAQTSLGPFDTWPQTLQGYVSMMLALPTPAIIFWGPDQVQLYNDGYSVIMGPRHPAYLGATYRECWPDTYSTISPWMEQVMKGEIVEVERTLIPLTRYGFEEEAYFTFTFSPLRDDRGTIAGVLQIVTEVTDSVLANRRLMTLQALAPAMPPAPQGSAASSVVEALAANPSDVAFALYYLPLGLTVGQRVSLQGATGVAPARLPGSTLDALHAVAERVFASNAPEELYGPLPGLSSEPPLQAPPTAVALPVRREGESAARGVIILGVNPRLRFDDSYREFFQRVSHEIAAHLALKQEHVLSDQLKLALDSAKLGSWHIDLKTRRILLSERTASFMGIAGPFEEDIGGINEDRIHPEDLERVNQAWQQAIARRELYSAEYRVRRDDGELRWLNSWGRATYAGDGTPLSLSGVSLDVTERKQAGAEMARQALRVVSLLELLPTPFYSADLDSRVTYVNPAAESSFGAPREQVLGQRLWDLFPGIEDTAFGELFKRVARSRERASLEHHYPALDKWYFSWAYPFEDGIAVVFVEVTPQVQARHRIEKLVEELAASVRARDEFMSIASHELKTPLSSLMLQTQGLQRSIERGDRTVLSQERMRKLIDQTERQVTRLSRLVDDMLDVARINTGKLTMVRARRDLCALTRETVERLRPQFSALHTPVEVSCQGTVLSEVDSHRIEQVVVNLLTNALRYGRSQPVTVTVEARGPLAVVSVQDRGIGISPGDQARIFERYERAISANEVSGLGLGLFISRQIVEGHGGRIRVESRPGEGSTFSFELAHSEPD